MAIPGIRSRLIRSQGRRRSKAGWVLLPAFLIVGVIGGTLLGRVPDVRVADFLDLSPAAATSQVAVTQSFSLCSGRVRVNCVVDGDTFWHDGVKIRIADINTPEVSQPLCAREGQLGRQATTRLQELLNAGPIRLRVADRDEDVYGRKLRIVERDGRSIGDVLVQEGLAHHWRGHKESWC